ncbi:MAG: class I SAM-dependent methyltransferase [Saprospiraceae bacterium]|nr:class I SAM-dependent methyltransferase [Saprospiraceae bacterium]
MNPFAAPEQTQTMRQYYRWHAAVYDASRWAFLFGRRAILQHLPGEEQQVLLEVGCGTGYNLRRLARQHPDWRLMGVDVSPDMLAQAAKATQGYSRRIQLFEKAYGDGQFRAPEQPDVVLFSYSLTMFNPGWEAAIGQAWADLKPGGRVAVVDFHDTASAGFRWWMGRNHVRMDGHLLPALEARFQTTTKALVPAWGGLWRYVLYVGRKA